MRDRDIERLTASASAGVGEEFRALADAMPQLIWSARPDGTIDYFNKRWIEYTGVDVDRYLERVQHASTVHPEDAGETVRRWRSAVQTGTGYEMEYRLRRAADGSYRWFLARARPLRGADGRVLRWIGTATDVDEQRRSRDSLRFVVEAGDLLASSHDVRGICQSLADLTIERFADWCFVSLLEDGAATTVAMAYKDRDLVDYLEQFRDRYPTRPEDPLMQVVTTKTPLLVERVSEEQLLAGARDEEHLRLLRLLEMHSVMIVPLATPAGTVHGALSMISSESGHQFDAADLEVACAVARRAAIALDNAKMLAHERTNARRLRFTGHINDMLLRNTDFWATMESVAQAVVAELADVCAVVRLSGETIRTEVAVHRDPAKNAAVRALCGQRACRPAAERELSARLRKHETVVRPHDEVDDVKARVWPYLSDAIDAFGSHSSVMVPLYSGKETYGAIAAYFATEPDGALAYVPLIEEIAARASAAVERAEAGERERRIATTLQQASLPAVIPNTRGLRFDAVYAPAGDEAEVGGDWYDAIELDDGSVAVSVGDVTGRGIHAAAIMSKMRHAMGIVPRHERDPANILDSAEWFLRKRYPDAIVTAFVGIIAPDRRSIRFANAGHPPPLLRRGETLLRLDAPGLPLGLRQWQPPAKSVEMPLQQGDLIAFYTDGLIECERDIVRGEADLERVLRTQAVAASPSPARLLQRACLPERSRDDVAIMTVSVEDAPLWSFSTDDARAAVDARQHFVEFLRDEGHGEDFVASAELVFGELLGNVVRHAPGFVEIGWYRRSDRRELHVIDSGSQFDASRHLPADIMSDTGRGLFIVRQLAAELRSEHVPYSGNHLTAIFG